MRQKELMIVDFGLARYLSPTTRSQTLVGTLGYCPMEQMMGGAGVPEVP